MIGILLAGGRAQRLGGGDKGRNLIGGATILDRMLESLKAQCDALVINVNGDPARFEEFGLPIVADGVPDQPGPLAGVLAGLNYVVANYPHARFALTVPTDIPFLPADLIARLSDAQLADNAAIACARSQGRPHPLTALWSLSLCGELESALRDGRLTKVSAFVERHAFTYVDWPAVPYDPFFNVNTNEDLVEAREIHGRFLANPGVGR